MEDKTNMLSKKAKEAEEMAQNFSEEVKLAAEAMRRTIRHRKTQVTLQARSVYHQIF
jgi:hypothetical protein